MDSIFFTRVFFLDRDLLPLVRLTFTIIGSILGVRPTATDRANITASVIFCLNSPSMIIMIMDIIIIYFMSILDMDFMPLSKAVNSFLVFISLPTLPRYVSGPVFITNPVALPLITDDPIRHTLSKSNTWSLFSLVIAFFSMGFTSPVKTDWFRKRSLVSRRIRSAGIMEPAFRVMISPTTTFSIFISLWIFPLIVVVVLYIFSFNFWLNLYTE